MQIDLSALARKARDAGNDPPRFVRECFEAASSRVNLGVTTVPLPQPNLAGLPKFGGAAAVGQQAAGAADRFGSAATLAQADADALLAAVRTALTGRLPGIETGKRRPLTGGSVPTLTQEAALRQLVEALRSVFGLGIREAALAVLTQAEESLNWVNNRVGAGLDAIARFLFRLGRVLLQVFASGQEIVAHAIYRAAAFVESIVAAVIPAVIGLLNFGASLSDFSTRVRAVIGSLQQFVDKAIGWALKAGISAVDALRSGLDGVGGRIEDWAVRVCKGALAAAGQVSVADLARALHSTLGFGIDKVANALRSAGIALSDIGSALIAEFGNDRNTIARAMYAAQASCAEIAIWVRGQYNTGASDMAQLQKDLGAGWHDIAMALRAAGFSASEAAQALRDKLGLNRDQVSTELTNASYSAQDVYQAVSNLMQSFNANTQDAIRNMR